MRAAELIGGPDRWARLLGWTTLAGLACGVAGPFGSYPANMFTRLAYWTGLFWAGTLLVWPSIAGAIAYGSRHRFPPLFAGGAAALAACVPLAMLAAGGGHLFWPLHASGMRALEWYCQTVFVALPAAALAYWLEIGRARGMAPRVDALSSPTLPDAGDPPAPGLPDHVLATALCLQMEDHHVRVHSHARSSLHFAAMRDVVRQLGEARGLQVHRSWWVTNGAVARADEDGRSATLILTNGLRVPVARSRIAVLRQRGWLAPPGRPFPAGATPSS